jgi:hypothetical protein
MNTDTFEKDFSHHPQHYFALLCILLTGLWGMFWFDYLPMLQVGIVISMGVSYVVWGIIHHALHKDLHIKIIMEYMLISMLVVLIFTSLILRT